MEIKPLFTYLQPTLARYLLPATIPVLNFLLRQRRWIVWGCFSPPPPPLYYHDKMLFLRHLVSTEREN